MKSSTGAEYKTARKIYRIKNSPLKKHAIHAASAARTMQKYLLERGWTASMASADKSSARKNRLAWRREPESEGALPKISEQFKKAPARKKTSGICPADYKRGNYGKGYGVYGEKFFHRPAFKFFPRQNQTRFFNNRKKIGGEKSGGIFRKSRAF